MGLQGLFRLVTPDRIRTGLQDLRVRNNRSNMPTRYKDEAAGSHAFGKPDRIRTPAGSHGFGTTYSFCPQGIRSGPQDIMGSEHQVVYAYKVSGRAA